MASKLAEIADEKNELEMTPMIDVTFLLLIFFMCTLKFKTLEGKLAAYLPKDVGVNQSDAEPIEKVEILVRVKKDRGTQQKLTGTKLKPGNPPRPWTAEDDAENAASIAAGKGSLRFQYNTQELVDKHADNPQSALHTYQIRQLEYVVGPFRTDDLQELQDKLAKVYKDRKVDMPLDPETGEKKEVPATIDARAGAVYEDVADVLDAALFAEFKEVTFVGYHGDNID